MAPVSESRARAVRLSPYAKKAPKIGLFFVIFPLHQLGLPLSWNRIATGVAAGGPLDSTVYFGEQRDPRAVRGPGPEFRIQTHSRRRDMANQRMTQTQLVRSLAESCEVNNKTARAFLDGLSGLAIAEVKKNGMFVLPGIGRLVRVDRSCIA